MNLYTQSSNIIKFLARNKSTILFFSLLYFISYIFWGLDDDIYYWCNSINSPSTDATCTLSLWIGKIWSSLFSNSIISNRILAMLFSIATIFTVYLNTIPKKLWKSNTHYLATAFILSASSINMMYRPDTTTTFFSALLFVIMLKRRNNYTLKNTLLLSIISSLAVSARFPNILIVLFIPLLDVVFISGSKVASKQKAINIVTYITSTSIVYYILQTLFIGNINWITTLLSALGSEENTTHSLSFLLERYFSTLSSTSIACFQAIVVVFIPCFLAKKYINSDILRILIYIVVCLYACKIIISFNYWPFTQISGWNRGISVILLILALAYTFKNKTCGLAKYYPVVLLLLMMFLCIAGSDTGISKIFSISVIFSPIILYLFWKEFQSLYEFKIFVLPVFLLATIYFSFKHHDRCDTQISGTTLNDNFPKLSGVLLPEKDNTIYNEFFNDLKGTLNGHPCIFYGARHAHWMYYLSGEEPLYDYSYLMSSKNKKEIAKILEIMKKNPNTLLIDSSNIEDIKILNQLTIIKASDNYKIYKYANKTL